MQFVNPRNDVAFKKIFGDENKTEILISFLNAVLDLRDDKEIQSVKMLNPYQTPRLKILKTSILDVRATDKRGITFIVEMQVAYVTGVKKRFLYYITKAYNSQINRGEDYPKLNQVIFIGILDFNLFDRSKKVKDKRYITRHQILDTETHEQEFKDLELNFLELPKFKKTESELVSMLDKWMFFIKHADGLEVIPEYAMHDHALQEAYKSADQFGWSKEDLEAYDYRGIKMQDARGALQFAYQQGKVDTARNLLNMGLSHEQIAQATGLSIEEIGTLANV